MPAPKGNHNTLGKHWKVKDISKLRKSHIGLNTWSKGRKLSEEHKKKIKENNARYWLRKKRPNMTGEKNWNWRGGIQRDKQSFQGAEYKRWRMGVFLRDNFTCQFCGNRTGGNLEAHHIKSWSEYPELRFDVVNGVTLCLECHKLTDNYGNHKKNN